MFQQKTIRNHFRAVSGSNSDNKQNSHQQRWLNGLGIAAALWLGLQAQAGLAAAVFINEFHYDNAGSDLSEGVEIAGIAGTDLSNWQLLFYNGNDGAIYKSENLSGVVGDTDNGFGVLSFGIAGLQNGPADAIALVDNNATVIEFISYEGSVLATEGAANGLSSIDIGIAEPTNTPLGVSLQRIGTGKANTDFEWQLRDQSFGSINAGQRFSPSAVPLPAGVWLLISGMLSLWSIRYRCSRFNG